MLIGGSARLDKASHKVLAGVCMGVTPELVIGESDEFGENSDGVRNGVGLALWTTRTVGMSGVGKVRTGRSGLITGGGGREGGPVAATMVFARVRPVTFTGSVCRCEAARRGVGGLGLVTWHSFDSFDTTCS